MEHIKVPSTDTSTVDMTAGTEMTGVGDGGSVGSYSLFGSVTMITLALINAGGLAVTADNVPKLVSDLMGAFGGSMAASTATSTEEAPAFAGRLVSEGPAVPIRKSITPDFLISLETGQQYKTLTRHLANIGLTADDYRKKWGLPRDYPMVAATYSQLRADRAKSQGLGSRNAAAAETATPAPRKRAGGRG